MISRRQYLSVLGLGAVSGIAGCAGQPDIGGKIGASKDWEVDPLEHGREVMARYYPWYSAGENWLSDSPRNPVMGEYNSQDKEVINQHITWALEHGINQFVMSWWGPRGSQIDINDVTIQDHFLEAELGSEMTISISYESKGRLTYEEGEGIPMNRKNKEQLREDFRYLEDNYFGLENYFEVDGKPAVFLYLVRIYTGDMPGAVAEIRDEVDDVYLIADIVDWAPQRLDKQWIGAFDGITSYFVYLPEVGEETGGDWDSVREGTDEAYRWWSLAAQEEEVDFIPMTMPGFNDTLARPQADHTILEKDVQEFREFNRMASEYMDPELNAISVTSFNEWQEDTSVEPGEKYGEKFLDAIEDTLCTEEIDYFDPESYDNLTLKFDETFTQESTGRDLALHLIELTIRGKDGVIASYNIGVPQEEPILTQGAYQPAYHDSELGYFRWLGGLEDEAHIRFKLDETATQAVFHAAPFRPGISADIYFNGQKTDSIIFDGELEEYTVYLA